MAAIRAALIAALFILSALVVVPIARLAPAAAAAIVRMACRAVLSLLGIRVRTHGASRSGLLVANHVSWIDVMLVLGHGPVCFLAKREVGGWPIVASLARAQGTVFVDRRRRRGIPAVNAAMAGRLAEGRTVVLFPEGTTHGGSGCGPFHTAHLACVRSLFAVSPARQRVAVQPVALSYSDPVVAWVGDDTLLPHLWRVLQRPAITCDLRFGQAIEVVRGYDRKALGRALRADVEGMLLHPATGTPVRRTARAAEEGAWIGPSPLVSRRTTDG